jgi:outer membrane protein TolC
MKNLLFLSLLTSFATALPLTLQQIEEKLENTHPLYLSIEEQKEANSAKIRAEHASNPFILSLSGAQATPDGADEEFEYSAGVGKTFLLGNQRTQSLTIATLHLQADALELEKKLLSFSNDIKADYHQSCLMQEQRVIFEHSYSEFEKLYTKKQKAYKYKEISKKELLQLEIEKADLKQKLQNFKAKEHISKQTLFDAIGLTDDKAELSCSDLHPMVFNEDDGDKIFALSIEALDKQILGAKKSANLYDKNFESIDLSVGFDKEIDMKRYGVGVSLPLSFSSKSDEYKKISALHQQRALKLQKQHMLIEKNRKFKQLTAKLENENNLITMTEESISSFKKELLPLIEKSYQFGESSVVEYLLSKQKLWQLQERLSEYKKIYYKTLFKLYTVAEIKEKE